MSQVKKDILQIMPAPGFRCFLCMYDGEENGKPIYVHEEIAVVGWAVVRSTQYVPFEGDQIDQGVELIIFDDQCEQLLSDAGGDSFAYRVFPFNTQPTEDQKREVESDIRQFLAWRDKEAARKREELKSKSVPAGTAGSGG